MSGMRYAALLVAVTGALAAAIAGVVWTVVDNLGGAISP